MLFLHRQELGQHDAAHAVGVLDQVFLHDDLEGGEASRGCERIAAVARRAGARVGPGLRARQEVRGDHAAQREPATHALAHGHDVGDDAVVASAPHRACPSEAGEHLVGDQKGVVLSRDRLDRSQEAVGRDHVARSALDGLHDDRRDLARRLVPDDVAEVVGARDAAVGVAQAERTAIAVAIRGRGTGRARTGPGDA